MNTTSDKKIRALMDANEVTQSRIVYREVDPIYGDESGKRTASLIERMEVKVVERIGKMQEIAFVAVSGVGSNEFFARHREGIRNGYVPSVSEKEHGILTANIFANAFKKRTTRDAYVY